jgi:hypothetical protein
MQRLPITVTKVTVTHVYNRYRVCVSTVGLREASTVNKVRTCAGGIVSLFRMCVALHCHTIVTSENHHYTATAVLLDNSPCAWQLHSRQFQKPLNVPAHLKCEYCCQSQRLHVHSVKQLQSATAHQGLLGFSRQSSLCIHVQCEGVIQQ